MGGVFNLTGYYYNTGDFIMTTSIERQANTVYEDIQNLARNGPVKIIPPPPGYKPPKSKYYYLHHNPRYSRPAKDII